MATEDAEGSQPRCIILRRRCLEIEARMRARYIYGKREES